MQNTLSASIFTFNPSKRPGNERLRMVLWNGTPTKVARKEFGSHELTFKTVTHKNIFRLLKDLRKELIVWVMKPSYGGKEPQVQGLNSKVEETIVWPITATYEPKDPNSNSGPDNEHWINHESEAYANQGLALAPVWRHERWQAFLYTLLPCVPIEKIPDRAYLDTYKHVNLFEAAARLEAIVEQRENERGVRLAGIHDSSPCWPKGL